jgi:hypothetical protein
MNRLFFCGWLVLEFFLLVYACVSLSNEILIRFEMLSPWGRGPLHFLSFIIGGVGIVMHCHPYSRFRLRNKE